MQLEESFEQGADADLAALWERDLDIATRYARAIVWDRNQVDDLVADAFARLAAAVADGRLEPGRDPRPYLLTAVRSACVDALRHNGVVRRSTPLAPVEQVGVEEVTVERDEAARIRTAFAGLSERHRTVLWLFDVERMPGHEVAQALELSVNGCHQLHHRAKSALRSRFIELAAVSVSASCRDVVDELARSERLSPAAQRHIDDCEACQERRDELVGFGARFPAVLLAAVGAHELAAVGGSAAAGRRPRGQRAMQAAGVAAGAAAACVAAAFALAAFVDGDDPEAARSVDISRPVPDTVPQADDAVDEESSAGTDDDLLVADDVSVLTDGLAGPAPRRGASPPADGRPDPPPPPQPSPPESGPGPGPEAPRAPEPPEPDPTQPDPPVATPEQPPAPPAEEPAPSLVEISLTVGDEETSIEVPPVLPVPPIAVVEVVVGDAPDLNVELFPDLQKSLLPA